jgi:hypothetical protein
MVQTLCVVATILLAMSAGGALVVWAWGRLRPDSWPMGEGRSAWWL